MNLYRIFVVAIFFAGCLKLNENLEDRIIAYSQANHCEGVKGCPINMKDITWFAWDTMSLYEDESGGHCAFKKSGEVVYNYLIEQSFDGPGTIEFGFGDQALERIYTSENCHFQLYVDERQNFSRSKVYFILPPIRKSK